MGIKKIINPLQKFMTCEKLIKIILEVIGNDLNLNHKSPLLGGDLIDSMSLVQICIKLEEEAELENFEFDWTSEKAMSNINSMFRTIQTLTDEYNCQKIKNGK